eukprot:Nk52_evm40s2340 gene=Nk52_evmTU40s2340
MASSSSSSLPLPVHIQGPIVKGFGRGSRELGIPTANFPQNIVDQHSALTSLPEGVYYGFATLHEGDQAGEAAPSLEDLNLEAEEYVYDMVMSIGWNPFYQNEKKSAETHLMHPCFDENKNSSDKDKRFKDLYGLELSVVVLGYLRGQEDFSGVEALIEAIQGDIRQAKELLGGIRRGYGRQRSRSVSGGVGECGEEEEKDKGDKKSLLSLFDDE